MPAQFGQLANRRSPAILSRMISNVLPSVTGMRGERANMQSRQIINALSIMDQREKTGSSPSFGEKYSWQLNILLIVVTVSLPELWLGWYYGDWQDAFMNSTIWFIFLGLGIVISLIIMLLTFLKWRKSLDRDSPEQAAKALLAALRAPDDATLPLATAQPTLLSTDPSEASENIRLAYPTSIHLAPAPRYWGERISFICVVLYFTFLSTQSQFIRDILHGNARTASDQYAQYAMLANLQFTLRIALFVLLILSFYVAHKPVRLRYLLATPANLQWRRFPRWVEVPWTSIRSIGCFTHESKLAPSVERGRTYLIAADEALIKLYIPGKGTTASAAKNRTVSERLLQAIFARTALPVRDLNPLTAALAAQFTPATSDSTADGGVQDASNISTRAADLLAAFPTRRGRWRRGRLAVLALYVVVVASMPFLAYHGLHDYAQSRYLATLPARIHSRSPLFADSLRQNDGLWHTQQGINDDPLQLVFSPTGYTLSGQIAGDTVEALLSPTYGPVAIEVTVQQRGAYTNDLSGGAGIVIRHAPGSLPTSDESCRFTVQPSGDWSTDCFLGGAGALSGHSTAIRRGPDARNTLLVVARGNFYVFYVNGIYVGRTFDEDSYGGSAGQVGLVNFQSGDQATFTDFAVWSVNPPPQFPFV